MEEYYDIEFAPKALFWLGDCNRRMEKFQEGLDAFAEFTQKYPEHEWIPRARNKIKQTQKEYQKYRRVAQGRRR